MYTTIGILCSNTTTASLNLTNKKQIRNKFANFTTIFAHYKYLRLNYCKKLQFN